MLGREAVGIWAASLWPTLSTMVERALSNLTVQDKSPGMTAWLTLTLMLKLILVLNDTIEGESAETMNRSYTGHWSIPCTCFHAVF
jgi:hypothetical protein